MPEQFVYSAKNNFSSGELTPTIEGRTELALYQNGVKKLINFMLLPSGGIMRRHGTQFVHLFEGNVPKKMITVMFSRKLSYLLIFEAHPLKTTCSFFVGGELLLTTKTLQDNGKDFHFRPQDFSYCTFGGVAYISFGNNHPIFKFSVDPEVVENFDQYLTNVRDERQRQGEEALMASSFAANEAINFPDRDRMFIIEPLSVHVNYFKMAAGNNNQRPFNEVIYNAEIDRINDELRTIHQQANRNIYEQQQQQLYCSSVVTFENRLWCFGVNNNIHSIWASYKGDFADFRMAYKTLLEARNPLTAFSATFSSSTFDNVLWSVPFASELLLGTTDGIYLVKEGDRAKGEFIKINKEIEVPIAPIKPVVLGKTVFFVEGNNRKINSLFYSQEKGGFQIADITPYAEHIFASGIKEIAGTNSPFAIIFAVLKNGSFASFTYSQDLKIMGWSQHWLGGNGFVLGVTTVYSDNEDRLYFHVRRDDDTGGGAKEYLEMLATGYFSAHNFEMHRPVYADCHININKAGEHFLSEVLKAAVNDNSSIEFRGDTTKLEHIIGSQAVQALKLDLRAVDIASNFKYSGRLIAEYEEQAGEVIKDFVSNYYNEYQPVIFECLAASFAYARIMGKLYAELETVFCGYPDHLAIAEQYLEEASKVGGDIVANIEQVMTGWQIPELLLDGGLMEYQQDNSFSFRPIIVQKLKLLDIAAIHHSFSTVAEIIKLAKDAITPNIESNLELAELHLSVARLNKRILGYYAKYEQDNKQDLMVKLKQFFTFNTIDFYTELAGISQPILTKYLYSSEVREFIRAASSSIAQDSTERELKNTIQHIIRQLITKLEQIYTAHRLDQIIATKRRQELTAVLTSTMFEQDLNTAAREYLSSPELANLVDEVIDHYEFAADSEEKGSIAADVASVASTTLGAYSEHDEEESPSYRVAGLMESFKRSIDHFRRTLIDYCCLILPQYHPTLLKDILADEQSLKLEKYLLLSRKYLPLFKKLFPAIGGYELGVIARNCQPAFDKIEIAGLLAIFGKMMVNIIGDEELQELKVLTGSLIKLKRPASHLSIGFPYSSVLKTFPFIFPEEVEHMAKMDVQFGVKVFNTKGGYIEQEDDSGEVIKQHINSNHLDSDQLIRFVNDKQYLATKEVCNLLSTPYRCGWVEFTSAHSIKPDVDVTFIVDRPYPASILKLYAKAKILPNYKGE